MKSIRVLSLIVFVLFTSLTMAQTFKQPTLSGPKQKLYPQELNTVILYTQLTNPSSDGVMAAQDFEASFDTYDCIAADDFTVPAGQVWSITQVKVLGNYWNGTGPATQANVYIYNKDNGSLPGTSVTSRLLETAVNESPGNLTVTLSSAIVLNPGNYWFGFNARMDYSVGGQWGFQPALGPVGNEYCWINPGGGFGQGTTWIPKSVFQPTSVGTEICFALYGDVVPVELTSFTAAVKISDVVLQWQTASEKNNSGFEIQRKSANGEFMSAGFVNGNGTSTEVHSYTFTDKNPGTGIYTYRLKQIDYDGTASFSKEVEVDLSIPQSFSLNQNYPNPFNPSTKLSFSLPVESRVSIKVFDALGSEVASVLNENRDAGNYELNFNAASLNSGIYYYRLEASGVDGSSYSAARKMILVK